MATPVLLDPQQKAIERAAWWARVQAANPDIEGRMARQPYTVQYDPEDDTLFIHIGDPRPAISITMDDRVYLRVDPSTLELVGIEVVDLQAPATTPALAEYLAALRAAVGPPAVAAAVRAVLETAA